MKDQEIARRDRERVLKDQHIAQQQGRIQQLQSEIEVSDCQPHPYNIYRVIIVEEE